MKEILFRGKRKENGKWVYGGIMTDDDYVAICRCNDFYGWYEHIEVIPETVGQFTGLYDATPWEELTTDEQAWFLYPENGDKRSKDDWKGKPIFEGDICRFREWNNGDMCWIGKVYFEHQQFVISGNKNKECETPFTLAMSRFISKNIEIIGNIHDNPELLKEGAKI